MELRFVQIANLNDALTALKDKQLPFKLSLIIAKDLALLEREIDFYVEREREFADKYLQKDEETGTYIQEREGVFRIKEGMESECAEARKELDAFTTEVELRTIPVGLVENLELTPAQVGALEIIIEEE